MQSKNATRKIAATWPSALACARSAAGFRRARRRLRGGVHGPAARLRQRSAMPRLAARAAASGAGAASLAVAGDASSPRLVGCAPPPGGARVSSSRPRRLPRLRRFPPRALRRRPLRRRAGRQLAPPPRWGCSQPSGAPVRTVRLSRGCFPLLGGVLRRGPLRPPHAWARMRAPRARRPRHSLPALWPRCARPPPALRRAVTRARPQRGPLPPPRRSCATRPHARRRTPRGG